MSEFKTIGTALAAAQRAMKSVQKSGHNKYDNYKYATLEDFVESSVPALLDHGISMISSVEEVESLPDRTTAKGGTEHVVRVKMKFTLLGPGGEMLEAFCFGEGQDRADKAIYKAITGARKYGLASILNLATTDDPERDENVGLSGGRRTTDEPKPPRSAQPTKAPRAAPKPEPKPEPVLTQSPYDQEGPDEFEPDLPEVTESHPESVAKIVGYVSRCDNHKKADMVAAEIERFTKAGSLSAKDAEMLGTMLTKKQATFEE